MIDNPPSASWKGYGQSNACMDRLCFYTKVKSMKAKVVQLLLTREMTGVPAIDESNKRDLSFWESLVDMLSRNWQISLSAISIYIWFLKVEMKFRHSVSQLWYGARFLAGSVNQNWWWSKCRRGRWWGWLVSLGLRELSTGCMASGFRSDRSSGSG